MSKNPKTTTSTFGGQTPTNRVDLNIDSMIDGANRLIDSVYRDLNMSTPCSSRVSQAARTVRSTQTNSRRPLRASQRPRTQLSTNEIDVEIARIDRFCDRIEQNLLSAVNSVQTTPSNVDRFQAISGSSQSENVNALSEDNLNVNQLPDIRQPVSDFIDLSETSPLRAPNSFPELVDIIDLCSPRYEPARIYRRRNAVDGRPTHYPLNDDVQIIDDSTLAPASVLFRKRKPKSSDLMPKSSSSNTDDSVSDKALMCPVCMENYVNRQPTATKCGHIFCNECIREAIRLTHKCPVCKTKISNKLLFRVYL